MRLIDKPSGRPGFCAVFAGKSQDPEGFVHTGMVLPGWDPEVTVSVAAVREMARLVGLPTDTERDEAVLRAEAAELLLTEAQEEIESLRAQVAAFGVLKQAGVVQEKRPPGRPRKNPEPVAA